MRSAVVSAQQLSPAGRLLLSVTLATIALVTCPGQSLAQLRAVQFVLDPGELMIGETNNGFNNVIQITGSIKHELAGPEEIPLQPQKLGVGPGNETLTQLPSDRAPLSGTVDAIIDLDNDRIQVIGAALVPIITGDYCPGNNPASEECTGNEDPGQYGFEGGVEGGGGGGAVRDALASFTGASDITNGNEISALNGHFFVLNANVDVDGTGVLQGILPPTRINIAEPNVPAHNEPDPDEPPPPPDFTGSLDIDGEQATATLPVYIPVFVPLSTRDDDGDGRADDYVKVLFSGELTGVGDLGDTLILGDANRDGKVDGLDVNIYSANYLRGDEHTHNPDELEAIDGSHPLYGLWQHGDFDLSTVVDDADLPLLVANFGVGAGSGAGGGQGVAAIPEPAGLVLFLFGVLLLGLRVRGHRRSA